MTEREHKLTIAMEECAEVAQRLSKILRFGMQEVQPYQPDGARTNEERLYEEYWRLRAALGMCGIDAWGNTEESRAVESAKVAKVGRFLEYSHECGTLQPEGKTVLVENGGPGVPLAPDFEFEQDFNPGLGTWEPKQ